MSTDLNLGRVAVITGASSGIGEATARALVAEGASCGAWRAAERIGVGRRAGRRCSRDRGRRHR